MVKPSFEIKSDRAKCEKASIQLIRDPKTDEIVGSELEVTLRIPINDVDLIFDKEEPHLYRIVMETM
ncbi:hypothetical protein NHG32_07105 [Aerococcaceae bacterium NML191219]|nr:hypothetical protein [Aerococcaceae bacterium NML191219]